MPPAQQEDSFIDEDEQSCPLCVEEFDLSDRNFKPCPCGYQICQFCFNNIKNNMNGLCPACRRPYDDKTIEWKVVTPEEVAQFKNNIQKNAKKKAEQRQKEAQKREVESLNRKHLAGLRVIQKNLVYVVGLSPVAREDDLLQTLRGEKYFGQYGKIIKIVVSKAKSADAQNNQSMGVYVTFARKEDAARCISAVNGSVNGDRQLRAQLGTTKYCSAYLRGETCTNKACMFLHEPGDNEDSYSRQDLSSINSVGSQTQRPLPAASSSSKPSILHSQAPVQQAPVAAASQPMARQASKEGSEAGDGSALPSSASWATREALHQSRRGSQATSGAASSPAVSNAVPADAPEEPQETIENVEEQPMDSPESPARPLTPRSNFTPLFLDLISSITSNEYRFATSSKIIDEEEAIAAARFPPLFDEFGGLKRKLAREQQEVAPLSVEQDGQGELLPAPEAAEEEEPESGSLQLGGEPEDNRDSSTQLHQGFHDQRRPSSQMPIQRANTNENFYAQSQNIAGSIGGRTLTPLAQQQLLLLKSSQTQPTVGFLDQFPPGIGPNRTQPALFQQQGHGRQASRYSFANDSMSSATSVKPAGNAKLMAQQASMMPQQGNQFYASSMQGPPPGLKSTGTPVNSNTLFGQSHVFGGMGGNSLFGSNLPGKENSFDTLQNMIPRNRGGISAGSSQVHDGKREYNFSSFLPYPSTSTPAPASGVLASLYGSQPGAFQDFGPKQKKKGKKHRHANTSSSGGSGLVDLADPSILQARMQHHQQQQSSGAGQGLYGGQVPGGYNPDDALLPLDDEASMSVDALVADSAADDPVPRPFDAFDRISRSSTPVVPPGFHLPHAHPTPGVHPGLMKDEPIGKITSRIVPTSAPFTPSRATSSSFVPRAATPLANVSVPPTPTAPRANPAAVQAKRDVKSLAANNGLSKAISTQGRLTLQPEDFPSLEPGKSKEPQTATPKPTASTKPTVATPMVKKQPGASLTPLVTPSGPKLNAKRSTAATTLPALSLAMQPIKETDQNLAGIDTPMKQSISSDFPALPPSTPASASVSSPAIRNAPKTLRVLPTPRGEVAPKTELSAPSSASSMHPPGFLPSRQPSLASISRLERSSTPVSEIISDNASITSASVSRANSPPPSRIGSAPVRSTTKAQQKKQRREVQKKKEESEFEAVVDKTEKEVEVGPIMGRMKKQKKAKPVNSAAGGSTPLTSRPPSPSPAIHTKTVTQPETFSPRDAKAQSPVEEVTHIKNSEAKGKNKQTDSVPQEPVAPESVQEEAPPIKPQPTAASVFQDLITSGTLPTEATKLSIFNNPIGLNHRHEVSADLQDLDQNKLIITDEDKLNLKQGQPVHKVVHGSTRIMLTPNGDCVRNLSQEEEDRYLELQQRILEDAGPTAFSSSRHNAEKAFTLIGGRAVPNGPPSFFPVAADPNSPKVDPVGKIQRDEALNYINQYVLPSLSANSQLEKALNASALDGGVGGGLVHNSPMGWDALGVRPRDELQSEQPYGGGPSNNTDGILATGLENMTAHFGTGKDNGRGHHLGNVTLLSLPDSESAMHTAKKETEKLEKSLNQLLKKNRRLLLGAGH